MSEPTSFPLRWPEGWTRTLAKDRRRARFASYRRALTVAMACDRLYAELKRLGVNLDSVILSTNVRPTLRGTPASNAAEPGDPGAACYFAIGGVARVLACDTWDRLADNIAAIGAHIDAIRRIDRYGVGTLDQLFEGFRALPAKGGTWRSMLGFGPDDRPSVEAVQRAFRERAGDAHPDRPGGSHEAMAALNAARDAALSELR